MRIKLLFTIKVCLILSTTASLAAQTVYIIVHGTWGTKTTWYTPGGDFYEELKGSLRAESETPAIVPFSWCGSNQDKARHTAAKNFQALLASFPPETQLHLIGHSHGGNVIMLACKSMPKPYPDIRSVWTLGTPVCSLYEPNMKVIKRLYHCYSFGDFVQPVTGFFERLFPMQSNVFNLRIELNGKEPNHSDLHNSQIARMIASAIKTDWTPPDNQRNLVRLSGNLAQLRAEYDHDYEKCVALDERAMHTFQNICRRSIKRVNPSQARALFLESSRNDPRSR